MFQNVIIRIYSLYSDDLVNVCWKREMTCILKSVYLFAFVAEMANYLPISNITIFLPKKTQI